MNHPLRLVICVAVGLGLTTGCATRFSPSTVRNEIVRQRGVDPLGVFELSLGRFTTQLIKSALTTEDGEVPFSGLREIQLSMYETPEASGPAIDVTLFGVRGWEPVIRARSESRSIMVLVRPSGKLPWSASDGSVGDLVVVGAGRRKVVYARLRGSLSSELPSTLGDVFTRGGPDEVSRVLTELAGG